MKRLFPARSPKPPLFDCKKCGGKLSRKAAVCPHCGQIICGVGKTLLGGQLFFVGLMLIAVHGCIILSLTTGYEPPRTGYGMILSAGGFVGYVVGFVGYVVVRRMAS